MSEQFRSHEAAVIPLLRRVRLILPVDVTSGDHPVMRHVNWSFVRDPNLDGQITSVFVYSPWLSDKGRSSKINPGTRRVDLSWKGTGSVQLDKLWFLDVEIEGGPIRPRHHKRAGVHVKSQQIEGTNNEG